MDRSRQNLTKASHLLGAKGNWSRHRPFSDTCPGLLLAIPLDLGHVASTTDGAVSVDNIPGEITQNNPAIESKFVLQRVPDIVGDGVGI